MNSSVKYYPLALCRRRKRQTQEKTTLEILYKKWLPTKQSSVSQSAIDSYRIAYNHIASIARTPVTHISYQDMQAVVDNMRNQGLTWESNYHPILITLTKY